MLVLTRRTNQVIHIGDDIQIRILDTKGRYVRVGIDAPKDVSIFRDEIYQKLKSQPDVEVVEGS